MYVPQIQDWVRARARQMAREALACAVVTGGLAAATLLATLGTLSLVLWIVLDPLLRGVWVALTGKAAGLTPVSTALLAFAGVAGLMVANHSVSKICRRSSLDNPRPGQSGREDSSATFSLQPVFQCLAAYPGSASATLTDLALSGPRLLAITRAHLARARRLRRLDVAPSATVLGLLLARGARLPFEEVAWRAQLNNPPTTYRSLHDLEAVVFLAQGEPGMTLRSDARLSLLEAVPAPAWEYSPGNETELNASQLRSLHELLGLTPTARQADLENATRRRLSECRSDLAHPAEPGLERAVNDHAEAVRRAFAEYQAEHRAPAASQPPPIALDRLWEERQNPTRH